MENTKVESKRGQERLKDGLVISDKMNKTVVVKVERHVKHRAYGKYVKRSTKCYAHDEESKCKVGDWIRIVETKPLSRLKRWRVREVLRKAQ